jgi:hypothetical protein
MPLQRFSVSRTADEMRVKALTLHSEIDNGIGSHGLRFY